MTASVLKQIKRSQKSNVVFCPNKKRYFELFMCLNVLVALLNG